MSAEYWANEVKRLGELLDCVEAAHVDLFDFRDYLVRYKLGKSSSVHEFRIAANNIVSARSELLKRHRDGLLYPKGFSAFQTLKIVSISDVS